MQDQQGSGCLQRVLGSMVHFMEHCILEHQSPSAFDFGRFGVFAQVPLFGQVVLQQLLPDDAIATDALGAGDSRPAPIALQVALRFAHRRN